MKNYLLLFVVLLGQFSFSNVVTPPIANPIGYQQICDEGPLIDGIEYFDLTSYSLFILQGNPLPMSNYTVTFYLTQSDAVSDLNEIVNPSSFSGSNGQTIYVRVTDSTTSEFSLTNFGLVVNLPPAIVAPSNPLMTCDLNDGLNDGYVIYDLNTLTSEILNGLSAANYTLGFYEAENAVNPIQNPFLYYARTGTIWSRVTNNLTGCQSSVSFNLVVEQLPEPIITNQVNIICVDFLTNTVEMPLVLSCANLTNYLIIPQVPYPTYNYQWYENGVALPETNSSTYSLSYPLMNNSSSVFTVVMESQSSLQCSSASQDYIVIQSGQASPIGLGYSMVNNSGNLTVTTMIQGFGTYEYSLDDGPRQYSPIFTNVSEGPHTITVWDTEGGTNYSCTPLVLNINTQLNTVDLTTVDFQISPNPVVDLLKIKSDKSINNIHIYNLLGQIVFEKDVNQTEVEINLDSLNSGSYLMRVQSDGSYATQIILKN